MSAALVLTSIAARHTRKISNRDFDTGVFDNLEVEIRVLTKCDLQMRGSNPFHRQIYTAAFIGDIVQHVGWCHRSIVQFDVRGGGASGIASATIATHRLGPGC